jgi:quinone-modifying oxidoreductase subunit QmoA
MMSGPTNQSILVVGGGMSGMTAAIEAAEAGYEVYLVEKNPYLGGRVAQLNQYFPKLCPPYCGLEINFRRIKQNPRIHVFTLAQVESISGEEGNFEVTILLKPRYVNEKCTCCGKCAEATTIEIDNPFNYGMDKIKAAYLPHDMAFPMRYVIDPVLLQSPDAQKVKEACPYDAIDLTMESKTIKLSVGAIIWATGWNPYDAKKLDTYGFGVYPDVITNVMMERMAVNNGPTQGRIVRPSTGQPPKNVAFIQCAGSRDENHLPFCSSICCLASMKQAIYVREQIPDATVYIFYIDIRATDRYEDFYLKVKKDEKIVFFKGKVAKIFPSENSDQLILRVENTMTEELVEMPFDLVVLATGMEPNTAVEPLPLPVAYDDYRFLPGPVVQPGIYAAGCVRSPLNVAESVQDGTSAAIRAIKSIVVRR